MCARVISFSSLSPTIVCYSIGRVRRSISGSLSFSRAAFLSFLSFWLKAEGLVTVFVMSFVKMGAPCLTMMKVLWGGSEMAGKDQRGMRRRARA